jgi:ring-1,2-phenylacetyl-CoA epoxidase subunit PaaC
MEGVSLWVVPSAEIVASDPAEDGRCSIRPRTRSTATRPSTTSPTRHQAHLMPSLPPIRPRTRPSPRNASPPPGAFDAPPARSTRPRARSALFGYLLRLGDDSLILGQRLGEWCGHAPSVEVDLSLANMALDLIGQATTSSAAGEGEGQGRDGDALAFHRDVLDFRNCLLVEQPNGDFAQTMARQFLFSTWQKMLFERLTGSPTRIIARRRQGGQGSHLSPGAGRRMGDPPRRRHRGEPPADGRRARLDAGASCPSCSRWTSRGEAADRRGIGARSARFRADYDARDRARVLAEATLDRARRPAPDPRRPARPP